VDELGVKVGVHLWRVEAVAGGLIFLLPLSLPLSLLPQLRLETNKRLEAV
jgi:hypothetical protein